MLMFLSLAAPLCKTYRSEVQNVLFQSAKHAVLQTKTIWLGNSLKIKRLEREVFPCGIA